ncbi:MAG TPA: DUF2950 domain-containing protein, partial [Verrucomicrobiae bacterium]|nr:DUF2950 domain-containing protein [Verrucomicrobiae bacterium]
MTTTIRRKFATKLALSAVCAVAWKLLLTASVAAPASAIPAASAGDEQRFASPEEGAKALTAAAQARDTNALHRLFGALAREFVSPDVIQAAEDREAFLQRASEKTILAREGNDRATLQLGEDNWLFPIPLVRRDGQWFFDTAAGREEILNRRIGRNEIGAIRVCHAFHEAQKDFIGQDSDRDGVREYARRLRSTPGKHDGLYWPDRDGSEQSPLGPLIAQAHYEGYRGGKNLKVLAEDQSAPYHGYYYKILTRQGSHALGGKKNYIVHGRMTGGYALVAWPSDWGNTGVMTFVINQEGKVRQKNLGPKTAKLA